MPPFDSPEFLPPQLFFPFFVAMWAFISTSLAAVSGWISLAKQFRVTSPFRGERFRFVSGSMGLSYFPVSYGSCLFVAVGELGFTLSILFLFRLFSPPLFIPWHDVKSVEVKRMFFMRYTVVRLKDHWPTISIRGAAGRKIYEIYTRLDSPINVGHLQTVASQ